MGFAIPSNLARAIANQSIEQGEVTRGYIGIVIQQLTPDLAKSFDMEPGQGILVAQVAEDSPADKAGSIILQVNHEEIGDAAAFTREVARADRKKRILLLVREDGMQRFVALQ